ncbi:MAG: hypothetical protein MPJ78_00775 [Hyphomicrobiaceae bacterium]|nr:hypothetical protein [Hyphomicrobiaceae bacterium]
MEFEAIREIIACLPRGRTLFYYFPDRYAIYLLSRYLGEGRAVAEVKSSSFAKLLQRPTLKSIVGKKGDGHLSTDDLGAAWAVEPECYLLTLGSWGPEKRNRWSHYYHQTSRPGANLVLQLNFSSRHNRSYRALIKPGRAAPFQTSVHPIARRGFHTLAWARLDVDLDTGEALIEEVQTDWLRYAQSAKRRADTWHTDPEMRRALETIYFNGVDIDVKALQTYVDEVLRVHLRVWDEAMLTAVFEFLLDELGVRRIYYHDYDCGRRLKSIAGSGPPRSVYSRLPSRFCFAKVSEAPEFLMSKPTRTLRTLVRAGHLRFWKLDFDDLDHAAGRSMH